MQINLSNIKKGKVIVVFALIFILSPFIVRSQGLYWDPIPNSDQRYEIQEIKCISSQTCIKRMTDIYQSGAILELTTDGGDTWKVIFTDTSIIQKKPYNPIYIANEYLSCDFVAPGTIILCRDSGAVYKSFDMGNNWEEEDFDKNIVRAYKMIDSDKGFKFEIKRNSELLNIFYTFNSGKIWNKLDLPSNTTKGIYYFDVFDSKDNTILIKNSFIINN